jgi:GT2 family glycosyltransferase
MTSVPAISFITVNWRSADAARRLVASVRSAVAVPHEVIIVNNDPGEHVPLAALQDLAAGVRVLDNSRNLGFAAGCNRGAAVARGAMLLFVNPDVRVTAFPARVLDEIAARFGPEVAFTARLHCGDDVASGVVRRFPTGRRALVDSLGLDRILPGLRGAGLFYADEAALPPFAPVEQPVGAFFGVSRGLFERLGGFDERFFVFLEEVDLALRIRDAGVPIVFVPDIVANHDGGHSTRGDRTLAVGLRWHSLRRFHRKHGRRLHLPPAAVLIGIEAVRFTVQRLVPRRGWPFNPFRALRIAFGREPLPI